MQILVVFFLAAIVGCFGEETECQKDVKDCVADYIETITDDDSSNLKKCKEIFKAIDCVEEKIESCAGDEKEDEIKNGLEELKKMKTSICTAMGPLSEDASDIEKCLKSAENSILSCVMESTAEVANALEGQNLENLEDRFICGVFIKTAECMLKKLEETCGDDAAKEALAQMETVPAEVYNACEASGILLSDALGLGERKK